jgi:hypothetical protein
VRGGTSPARIASAALPRLGDSQSMITTVLPVGRRGDCLWAGKVEEGDDGADGASMVRVRLMGRGSDDCTERVGGSAVMPRLLRLSTRTTRGDIVAWFGSYELGREETTDSEVFTGPTRGLF